jgi:two-component system response regulator VanR
LVAWRGNGFVIAKQSGSRILSGLQGEKILDPSSRQILIVDDDPDTCALIADVLRDEGYVVQPYLSGETALKSLERHRYDLILSDIRMPRITGIDLLLHVRRKQLGTEVILMTAYASLETAIQALQGEAFDYLIKPFSLPELRRRVREALERMPGEEASTGVIRLGDLTIDLNARRVWNGDREVELTRREYEVLAYLVVRRGCVVPSEDLIEKLWDEKVNERTSSTLRSCIRRLRDKLGDDAQNPRYVKTVWGIGYQMGD